MRSPLGRDDEISSVSALIDAGRSVLLVGGAGVGKSHLASAIALQAAADDWMVERIVGSPSIQSVRFGAIQHLIGPSAHASPEMSAVAAERQLRSAARDRPVLLFVDDIDGIDDGSVALVHKLMASGIVVLATVRSDGASDSVVLPLWKDELMERVSVAAIHARHIGSLAAAFLGGPLELPAIAVVEELTLGNPLFVRELLADGQDTGALIEEDGIWRLTRRLTVSHRISDLVSGRFENLATPAREALELVALGEPMPVSVIERITSPAQLEALERAGLVELARVGPDDLVRTSHPLVGEVVRASTAEFTARRVSTLLHEAVLDDDRPRPADLVRAVTWGLDAGAVLPARSMIAAATVALASFDGHTARRFIEATGRNDCETLLLLGRAHLLENRPGDAAETLTLAQERAAGDHELSAAAAARAEVLLFGLGDREAADRVLADAYARVSETNARAALASGTMLSAALRGDFQPALDMRFLLEQPELNDPARVAVLRMTTLAQVMTGRHAGLAEDLEAGIHLARRSLHLDPTAHVLLLVTHWLWTLDRNGVEDTHREVLQARRSPERTVAMTSMYDYTIAVLEIFRGDAAAAERHLDLALADPSGDVVGQSGLLRAFGAWLHATQGRHDAALAMHDEALGHPGNGPRERAFLGRARVALLAYSEDIEGAIAECKRAAAESADNRLWAIWLLHDAVRLGRPDAVRATLEAEVNFIGTAFTGVIIEHACALDDGNPIALVKVAEAFAHQGARLYAAEAYAQAVPFVRDSEEAARYAQHAWTLFDACNSVNSPVMRMLPRPLSEREAEVAGLAASGFTSRAIGERLFVSQRTVDNHLQRVFKKLGIGQREDLVPLFSAERSDTAVIADAAE